MVKETDLNLKNYAASEIPFMNLLLKTMDASDLSLLINGMYKTVKDGFSFSILQEIFDLAEIESSVYLLTFEQLVKIQPIPSVVYLKEQKSFAILDDIQANKITLSADTDNILTLNTSEFQQTWDGVLLPIDSGAFSTIPSTKMTSKSYQFHQNDDLEITVSPKENHSKSAFIQVGLLSASAYVNECHFSFETILPACKGMTLVITAKNRTNKEEHIISKYDIPVSLHHSINILRFYFAKTGGQDNFNLIGLRGSVNQIFKANEK